MGNDLPTLPPDDAPDSLETIWPLVRRWGQSDDQIRRDLTSQASDGELEALVMVVSPLHPAISAYLDETGDAEHAVPYGDLAQAAMEARFELDRRTS
jgi:hypothetical protein